jgi:hypothetical protein
MRKSLLFIAFGLIAAATTISGCRLFSTHIDTSDPYSQSLLKNTPIKEVRAKTPFWWFCFGDLGNFVTIGETLYVDKKEWFNDVNLRYTEFLQSTLSHESTHAIRQAKMGLTTWVLFYVCSKSFRWEEEKAAYRAEWAMEIDADIKLDTYDSFAKWVSGPNYYGMVSYEEAYDFMVNTVAELTKKAKK